MTKVTQQHRAGEDCGGGVCFVLAGDIRCGAVYGLEHGGKLADGVNIAACRVADTTGHCTGEVSYDVAEEVIGDNHVESGRVGDHEDGGGVNMQVVGLNLGEFSRDFGEVAVVEAACVGEHVGLVHEGDLLAAEASSKA